MASAKRSSKLVLGFVQNTKVLQIQYRFQFLQNNSIQTQIKSFFHFSIECIKQALNRFNTFRIFSNSF